MALLLGDTALQADADLWIKTYNEERPHSGKFCYGKTPMQTFLNSKKLALEKNLDTIIELSDNYTKKITAA